MCGYYSKGGNMINKNIIQYIKNAINNCDYNYIKNLYYYNRPAFQAICYTLDFNRFIENKIHNINSENITHQEIMMWDTLVRINFDGAGILTNLSQLPINIKENIKQISNDVNPLNEFDIYWKRSTNLFKLIGSGFIALSTLSAAGMTIGCKFLNLQNMQPYFFYLTLVGAVVGSSIYFTSNVNEIIFNIRNYIAGPHSIAHIINTENNSFNDRNYILK